MPKELHDLLFFAENAWKPLYRNELSLKWVL